MQSIGIDWGVRAVATTTDAKYHLLHSSMASVRAERSLGGSGRWRGASRPAASAASKGYLRRETRVSPRYPRKSPGSGRTPPASGRLKVVAIHGALAVEDFKPRFLAKSTMARKSADGAIGATKRR